MSFSRRRFLGMMGAGLLSLSPLRSRAVHANSQLPLVLIHHFDPAQTTITDAVRATMLAATNMAWLKQEQSVLVKVASNSYYAPPAVTSPAVLAGVINVLREYGAGQIYVGDMSGAYFVRHLPTRTDGSTRSVMRTNGLLQAAEETGATVHCFEEVPFDSAYIPGVPSVSSHSWGTDLQIAEILDRVDHIINLPRLGKHVLAGASLGLKNAIGYISDNSRMVLHRDAETFHQKIAEINAIPQLKDKMRLTMTLVDAALTTFGPDHGYHLPLDTPLIIASENIVNHDQIALLTLLWGRQMTPAAELADDPYLQMADIYNKSFVQEVWGQTAQTLPIFEPLEASEALTHINLAYDILHGGRPAEIHVKASGLALDERLTAILTGHPDLNIVLEG
ncbi:MAG: DUF362 domain-containing protein [Chloroflexi bacterium]|nr:DUF362 domain-containing protein [Chloroflexota bacterium]